jgi:Tol biopolymer transport system component
MVKKAIGVIIAIALVLTIFISSLVINRIRSEQKANAGTIVFISSRHSKATDKVQKTEVYTMRADGSKQAKLTDDAASYRNPSWSPDGKSIVLTRGQEIYSTNPEGLDRLKIAELGSFPQWSPDGKKILYVRVVMKKDYFLTVVNADGGNKKEIATGYISQMTWSPDGKWIAYTSGRSTPDQKASIRLVKPDGTGDAVFPPDFTDDAHSSSFSPDGKKLVFSSFTGKDTGEVYVADVETGKVKKLSPSTKRYSWKYLPKWSPDGKHIAFLATDVPPWSDLKDRVNVVITDTNGKKQVTLTTLKKNQYASDISWADGGKAVLYTITQVKQKNKQTIIDIDLCLTSLEGKTTKLTNTHADYEADWFGNK